MKILKFPDPKLLTPCDAVVNFDKTLLSILDSMWEIMKDAKGIGLAANQVGISLDAFVMEGPNGRLNMVNPYISVESEALANMKEGCLSTPGEFVVVPGRAKWVQVIYQDEKGNNKSLILEGIHAVACVHEIEHLDGKSFLQHSSFPKSVRKRYEKKWGLK